MPPRRLTDFVGQEAISKRIHIDLRIKAVCEQHRLKAKLFIGPSGMGKRTLATVIARELGATLINLDAGQCHRIGGTVIQAAEAGPCLLFLENLNALPESAIPELTDIVTKNEIPMRLGVAEDARTVGAFDISSVSVVASSLELATIPPNVRKLFGETYRFKAYDNASLREILKRFAVVLPIEVEESALTYVATCSRGNPRIGINFLHEVQCYCQAAGKEIIDEKAFREFLGYAGFHSDGLTSTERNLLELTIKALPNQIVDISALSTVMDEEPETLGQAVLLLHQAGYLQRTIHGFEPTDIAFAWAKAPSPSCKASSPQGL